MKYLKELVIVSIRIFKTHKSARTQLIVALTKGSDSFYIPSIPIRNTPCDKLVAPPFL